MKHLPTGLLLLMLIVSGPAAAAEWEVTQTPITTAGENADLGISGKDAVVDSQDRIHLLYQTTREDETFQVLYTQRGTDGTWSPAQVVSPPEQSARNASLAVDHQGRLHAFWEDAASGIGDIVHRQREADGTWGDPEYVSPAAGSSRHAVAAVDAFDRVHVVWVDGRGGTQQLLYSSRAAGDTEWSPAVSLSPGGVVPGEPNIAADGLGSVHVVWSDRGNIDGPRISYDVLYLKIDPGPLGVPNPVRLVATGWVAVRPYLQAMEDGTLHLVWLDNRGASGFDYFEIYYKRFLPGIGWGKDKRFTYDYSDHGHPVIVAGPENTLNLAWEGYEAAAPDIFFRQITWETGWDPERTQLTNDASSSQSPTLVALSTGEMVMVWSDSQGSGTLRINVKEGNVQSLP